MEESLAAAERHVAAFNRHDLDAHSANATQDVQWTQPGVSVQGRDAVGELQQALWTALPDARLDVVTRVAQGDTVISEQILSGTHNGPLVTPAGTIPPSGRSVRVPFVTVQVVRRGKISSERVYFDQLEFLGQLGMTDPTGAR